MANENMLWDHVQPVNHANISMNGVIWRDKILIRGDLSDKKFQKAIKSVLKCAVPSAQQFTTNDSPELKLAWTSPDELMLDCPHNTASQFQTELIEAFGDLHSAVVDVSDYYRNIILSGKCRNYLINKASPFNTDLLSAGMVVGTHYANATIVLSHHGDYYDIQVRSSFFPYLWQFLNKGAQEYLV